MHLIISIALGIVLAFIILSYLPEIFMIGRVLLGLMLIATVSVLAWNFPILLAFVAVLVAILGAFWVFSRLTSEKQQIALVVLAAAMTVHCVWWFYRFVSGQMEGLRAEGWFISLLLAVPPAYLWLIIYKTRNRRINPQ